MTSTSIHHHVKTPADAAADRHKALVKQTEKWVGQAFYGTLLKQMRDDPFKSKIFDGGRGGQMFNEMLDEHLSERMSRGAPHGLVNAIVNKIEGPKAAASYLRQSKKDASAVNADVQGRRQLSNDAAIQARSYATPTR